MGTHANNMVSQPANQGQFLPQGQFPGAAGGTMNVNMGLGHTMSQAPVAQVRMCTAVRSCVCDSTHYFVSKCGLLCVSV